MRQATCKMSLQLLHTKPFALWYSKPLMQISLGLCHVTRPWVIHLTKGNKYATSLIFCAIIHPRTHTYTPLNYSRQGNLFSSLCALLYNLQIDFMFLSTLLHTFLFIHLVIYINMPSLLNDHRCPFA